MRLTLRTLLAYLDDVLDPADKDELSQKIESSEFAEDLVHRTRDTMRRLRLSAPQVVGTGMGLDPNTVAEYLDNVLPPEQVGDFERICLESDVHLAEAAACHHVLTMVLGEPADVEPRARQRMYAISLEARERKQLRVESAHRPIARGGSQPQAAATVPIAHQPTTPVEIPEYLRAGSWWTSRAALAALAVAVLLGATWFLVSGLTGWMGSPQQTGAVVADNPEPLAPSAAIDTADQASELAENNLAPTTQGDEAMETESTTLAPLASPPQPFTPGLAPPETSAAAATDPYTIPSGTPDRYEIETSPATTIEQTAPPVADTTEDSAMNATDTTEPAEIETAAAEADRYADPPSGPAAAIPQAEVETSVATARPIEADTEAQDTAASEGAPLPPPSTIEEVEFDSEVIVAEEVPAGPIELGTYLGGKTVLLRYDDEQGAWFRIEPRDAVMSGQRLVALPEFRPKVTLASGVHLDISGGSQIVLHAARDIQAEGLMTAAADDPVLEVVYGRIVLINTSMEESGVRLQLGPTVGDAQLARNATLAVEAQRQYVPGNDPRKTPSPVVVQLFAPEGGITWQDASGEKIANAPSRWTIEGGETSAMLPEAAHPDWIDHEPGGQSSEQRFGAPVVESTLVSNQPVDTQLLELFQGSGARREVKSLVTRASIHVGLFEPFVEALRDSEQRPNWKSHIEALRAAMGLSPESAQRVWQALVDQRDDRAADLYDMLCGYNAEQIGKTPEERKTGALARLIDWLEEDSLDYRVLAVHDLAEITGKRLLQNPAGNSTDRALGVRRWRARLESDELRPVEQK